ncbi:hypothetical protein GCM10010421_38590 [Streptomyces glaucus]|uniref:Secreted protein n=1 Tax=Streptomyces glaucus TaxID=284029 RepID=A0ABP5X4Y7_9ACTN
MIRRASAAATSSLIVVAGWAVPGVLSGDMRNPFRCWVREVEPPPCGVAVEGVSGALTCAPP